MSRVTNSSQFMGNLPDFSPEILKILDSSDPGTPKWSVTLPKTQIRP